MKKYLALFTVVFAFYSCASGPGPDGEGPAAGKGEVKEPKLVSAQVPRLLKSVSYFSDDAVDEITVYSYEKNSAQPQKEETYDAYNTLQERIVNKYEDGKLISREYYDSFNSLVSAKSFRYDGMRNMIQENFLDDTGKILMIYDYEYDAAGNKLQWKVSSPVIGLLAITEYVYKKGKVISINSYDTGGALADMFEYDYKKDNPVKFTHYDAGSNLLNYSKFEYDDNDHLAKQLKYRKNNSVEMSEEFEYDGDGNIIGKKVYDSSGNLRQRFSYEYEMVRTEIWTREY